MANSVSVIPSTRAACRIKRPPIDGPAKNKRKQVAKSARTRPQGTVLPPSRPSLTCTLPSHAPGGSTLRGGYGLRRRCCRCHNWPGAVDGETFFEQLSEARGSGRSPNAARRPACWALGLSSAALPATLSSSAADLSDDSSQTAGPI